jgi:hypothetical protein
VSTPSKCNPFSREIRNRDREQYDLHDYATMLRMLRKRFQPKIHAVYTMIGPTPNSEHNAEYQKIQIRFPGGIRQLNVQDPEVDWAVSKRQNNAGGDRSSP